MEMTVMNRNHIILAAALQSLVLLSSCQKSDEPTADEQKLIEIVLDAPGSHSSTRAQVLPSKESLTLTARFNKNEKFQAMAVNKKTGEKEYLREHEVKDVSDDGKTCTISIGQPSALQDVAPTIYGASGKEMVEYWSLSEGIPRTLGIKASLIRTRWANFNAPVWFEFVYNKNSSQHVQCKHLGTYEVLHIKNLSSDDITFKLQDFAVADKWYHEEAVFLPISRTVATDLPEYFIDKVTDEAVVKVVPQAEETVISWYMPTGTTINQAKLIATVNGTTVRSQNTLSSEVKIETGHAYHMYVTWDGKQLTFGKGGIKEAALDIAIDNMPGEEL